MKSTSPLFSRGLWPALLLAAGASTLLAGIGTQADPITNGAVTFAMDGGNRWYELNDGNAYAFTSAGLTYVGYNSSGNHLTVKNGSDITATGSAGLYIGVEATSSNNTLTVDGEGSSLTSGWVCVGVRGSGTLSAINGGKVTCTRMFQTGNDNGYGNIVVSGASSGGTASTIDVTDAGNGAHYSYIGRGLGTNTITVSDGGVMKYSGAGSRVFVGGGSDSAHLATCSIAVSGINSSTHTASRLDVNGSVELGYYYGRATLDITGGGHVRVSDVLRVGNYSSSSGSVRVAGSGSFLGVGTLDLNNHACQADLSKVELSDGGLLACSNLSNSGVNTQFYFDGGTLAVSGDVRSSIAATLLTGSSKLYTFDTVAGSYMAVDSGNFAQKLSALYYDDASTVNSLLTGSYTLISAVPEPSTCALLGGLAALGLVALRRKRRPSSAD